MFLSPSMLPSRQIWQDHKQRSSLLEFISRSVKYPNHSTKLVTRLVFTLHTNRVQLNCCNSDGTTQTNSYRHFHLQGWFLRITPPEFLEWSQTTLEKFWQMCEGSFKSSWDTWGFRGVFSATLQLLYSILYFCFRWQRPHQNCLCHEKQDKLVKAELFIINNTKEMSYPCSLHHSHSVVFEWLLCNIFLRAVKNTVHSR